MRNEYSLALLREQWKGFLENHGHQVKRVEGVPDILTSNSNKHNSFRWLLFVAKGKTKILRCQEHKKLATEIRRAKANGQKPYVVVYFSIPEPKLIVKPAIKALETGRIGSTRGGFAWLA